MKETTIHSLVIARTLLERSAPLCHAEDRHLASAGLVILQDALETVFYALLIELDVDATKNLERKGFDELIGELKEVGVTVPKSGTLKALNKQRVLTKHYAQVAEPITVRNYYQAAESAIESLSRTVTGQSIRELFIADLLKDGPAKEHLKAAEVAITKGEFFNALIETRKAIFVEFEKDYSIYGWREYDGKENLGFFGAFMRGGYRAPAWTRNKEWIDKNVKKPTDYVQIDHENWRLQAMEFGIHTVELANLRRLTPDVFRGDEKERWAVTYEAGFPDNNATQANAGYCLDRAVSMILKKQQHADASRTPSRSRPFAPPAIYIGRVLHEKPDTSSPQVHVISENFRYTINYILNGFHVDEQYYEVTAESVERDPDSTLDFPLHIIRGFLRNEPEEPGPSPEPVAE